MTRELEQTGDVPFFLESCNLFSPGSWIRFHCNDLLIFFLPFYIIQRSYLSGRRNLNAKSELESFFTRNLRSANREKARARIFGSETETSISHRRAPQFFLGMVKIYSVFWFQLQGKRQFWFIVFTLQKMEREKKGQKNENGNVSSSELYRIAVCVERGIKWMEPLPAIFLECSHFYTQSYDFYRLTCENHENLVHSVIHKVSTSDN